MSGTPSGAPLRAMGFSTFDHRHRPRELRRRVVLPARMRVGAAWSDACILNVSTRGMLIQARRGVPAGSLIELQRGDHVVRARVMWQDGLRAGLEVDEHLPVEDILSMSQAPGLQLTAACATVVERRSLPLAHDRNRLRGRAMEFVSFAFIAMSLSAAALAMVNQALKQPLAAIEAALGG